MSRSIRYVADPLFLCLLLSSFQAPEIFKGKPYDEKADVWSLAIVIYICLCGLPPYVTIDDANGHVEPFWVRLSDECLSARSDDVRCARVRVCCAVLCVWTSASGAHLLVFRRAYVALVVFVAAAIVRSTRTR